MNLALMKEGLLILIASITLTPQSYLISLLLTQSLYPSTAGINKPWLLVCGAGHNEPRKTWDTTEEVWKLGRQPGSDSAGRSHKPSWIRTGPELGVSAPFHPPTILVVGMWCQST